MFPSYLLSLFRLRFILLITSILGQILFAQTSKSIAELITSVHPRSYDRGSSVKDGIQGVYFHQNKLYVVNVWSGLQIIDVSDPTQPVSLGGKESYNSARSIIVEDNLAYVADDLGGLVIFDVTDSKNPLLIKSFEVPGSTYSFKLRNKIAYIASGSSGLQIVDVRNPKEPKLLGGYITPDWAWGIDLYDKYAFVADKTGGIIIIDISNPEKPELVSRYDTPSFCRAVQVEYPYAFVADGPAGVIILDISDITQPRFINSYDSPGYANSILKDGKYVYIADVDSGMQMINISDIKHPRLESMYRTPGKVYSLTRQGSYIFIADYTSTLVLRQDNPPELSPIGNKIVDENKLLTIQLEGSDVDKDLLIYSIENLPDGAKLDTLAGIFSWTPTYDQPGNYKVKFRVTEKTVSQLFSEEWINIKVNHVNRPPVMPELTLQTVDENSLLTFTLPEATDPDKEDQGKLTYSVAGLPLGAHFDDLKRQSTWTPTYDQSGTYQIQFTVTDGGADDRYPAGNPLTDSKIQSIKVNHVNRSPVMAVISEQVGEETSPLTFTIAATDPDKEDIGKLTYRAENLPPGAKFDEATQTFSWTPNFEQAGKYNGIKCTVTDGGYDERNLKQPNPLSDSKIASIMIKHVNRPPVVDKIGNKTIEEGKELTFTVTASDPDKEDLGKLTLSVNDLPEGASFDPKSGLVKWTPNFEQAGLYNVTFVATDAGYDETKPAGNKLSGYQSIVINIINVNRPPVLAAIPEGSTSENQLYQFHLSATDPDSEDKDKLTFSASNLPRGSTFDPMTHTFSWTPDYEQSGVYSNIKFSVSDGKLSDSKTATIIVKHINRPPTLAPIGNKTTDENKPVSFRISGSDPDKEDLGKLSYSATDLPSGVKLDSKTGEFLWTPSFDDAGLHNITFKVTDGGLDGTKPEGNPLTAAETITININNVNRPPTLPQISGGTGEENKTISFVIPTATDPDKEDLNKLTYSVANLPPGATFDPVTRTFSWTPSYEQSGIYPINFQVSDGQLSASQIGPIIIKNVNRPPAFTPISAQSVSEMADLTFPVSGTDPDKEDAGKLIYSVKNLPLGATFNTVTKIFHWKPNYEQAGSYPVIFTVTDPGALLASQTVDIQALNTNRPPVFKNVLPQTGEEGKVLTFSLSAEDPDKEDIGKLTFKSENSPPGATMDEKGNFSWNPSYEHAGIYRMNVEVSDGQLSTKQVITINIKNVNRPPVLTEIPLQTVNEQSELNFTVSGSDPDSEDQKKLMYSSTGLPSGASFLASTQTFHWKPSYEQAGTYSLIFTVKDPGGLTASQTATVKVNQTNRPPSIGNLSNQIVDEGKELHFLIPATDPDKEDLGKLTLTAENLPPGVNLESKTGQFRWTPTFEQAGNYSVTFNISDGNLTATKVLAITVRNLNRAPKIDPVQTDVAATAGKTVQFKVSATDPDNDPLTFSSPRLPAGANFDPSSGEFSWTPTKLQVGTHKVTIYVSDGKDRSPVTITIKVSPAASNSSAPSSPPPG